MAKYTLTFGTDRIAGSRGGSTFQKSGSTFVIRKRNVPVQKKSESQTAKQNAFGSVTQNWRKLDTLEKDSFENEAINYPRTDSLGNTYYLNGQNLQNSSNLNLVTTSQPQINTMPSPQVFPVFSIYASGIDITGSSYVCQININPIPAGFALKIFATNKLETYSENQPMQFKLITTLPPGQNQVGGNFWSQYVQAWGSPAGFVNKYLASKCVLVAIDSGIASPPSLHVGDIAP